MVTNNYFKDFAKLWINQDKKHRFKVMKLKLCFRYYYSPSARPSDPVLLAPEGKTSNGDLYKEIL